MLSSDEKIEEITRLINSIKNYIKLRIEYTKLDVIQICVRLITAIAILAVLMVMLLVAAIYFSFAATYAIDATLHCLPLSFLIVGAFYILLIILIVGLRHTLIEKPLVKFLTMLFTSNK